MKQIELTIPITKPVYIDRVRFAFIWWDYEALKLSVRYSLGYEENGKFIKTKEHQIELIGNDYDNFANAFNSSNLLTNPAEDQFLGIINTGEYAGVIAEVI